jgi:hypothetical protein
MVGSFLDSSSRISFLASNNPNYPPSGAFRRNDLSLAGVLWVQGRVLSARGLILSARISRQVNGLSETTAAAVQSRAATARTLTDIVGEAAKASACLAGKVALLAGEARTALPALSSGNLVEAELDWLDAELQNALVESGRGSKAVTEAGTDAVAPELPAKPQWIN